MIQTSKPAAAVMKRLFHKMSVKSQCLVLKAGDFKMWELWKLLCLNSHLVVSFLRWWKQIVVISSGQLLPVHSAGLHQQSHQSRSSEGVLRSVGIDVPDI